MAASSQSEMQGLSLVFVFSKRRKRSIQSVPDKPSISAAERIEIAAIQLCLQVPLLTFLVAEFHLSCRKRFDIIQVFKIVNKIDDIDMSTFFTFTEKNQLRGHNLKLNKPCANKSIKLHSFP